MQQAQRWWWKVKGEQGGGEMADRQIQTDRQTRGQCRYRNVGFSYRQAEPPSWFLLLSRKQHGRKHKRKRRRSSAVSFGGSCRERAVSDAHADAPTGGTTSQAHFSLFDNYRIFRTKRRTKRNEFPSFGLLDSMQVIFLLPPLPDHSFPNAEFSLS